MLEIHNEAIYHLENEGKYQGQEWEWQKMDWNAPKPAPFFLPAGVHEHLALVSKCKYQERGKRNHEFVRFTYSYTNQNVWNSCQPCIKIFSSWSIKATDRTADGLTLHFKHTYTTASFVRYSRSITVCYWYSHSWGIWVKLCRHVHMHVYMWVYVCMSVWVHACVYANALWLNGELLSLFRTWV